MAMKRSSRSESPKAPRRKPRVAKALPKPPACRDEREASLPIELEQYFSLWQDAIRAFIDRDLISFSAPQYCVVMEENEFTMYLTLLYATVRSVGKRVCLSVSSDGQAARVSMAAELETVGPSRAGQGCLSLSDLFPWAKARLEAAQALEEQSHLHDVCWECRGDALRVEFSLPCYRGAQMSARSLSSARLSYLVCQTMQYLSPRPQ